METFFVFNFQVLALRLNKAHYFTNIIIKIEAAAQQQHQEK